MRDSRVENQASVGFDQTLCSFPVDSSGSLPPLPAPGSGGSQINKIVGAFRTQSNVGTIAQHIRN